MPDQSDEVATLLWAKTHRPLRAAVLASQVCLRLSDSPHLRPDRDALMEQSQQYEGLAISLLDAVRESEDAFELITLCLWQWSGTMGDTGGVKMKWRRVLHWREGDGGGGKRPDEAAS